MSHVVTLTRIAAALAGLVSLAAPALAQSAPQDSEPDQNIVSEMRVGALAHDLPILGPQREHGADLNAEVVFVSPVSEQAVSSVSPAVQWLLRPRPVVGGTGNLWGYTSQAYVGADWTAVPAHNLLHGGDRLLIDLGFGGAVNNDPTLSPPPTRAHLGSHVLFHPNLQLGYGVDARSSVGLYYEHSSNAHLARVNEGLNNIGLRYCRRL